MNSKRAEPMRPGQPRYPAEFSRINHEGIRAMKKHILISFIVLLPLILGSVVVTSGASPNMDEAPATQTVTYQLDEENPLPQIDMSAPQTHLAVHGTMWAPERRYKFSIFKPYGWGTQARAKAAGDEWVHIPVPLMTFQNGVAQKIYYVEFCMKSTNGAATKPVKVDLWDHVNRFYSSNISWPANNNINCHGVFFSPAVWKQDLGISVMLRFANATDKIVMYKAWVSTVQ